MGYYGEPPAQYTVQHNYHYEISWISVTQNGTASSAEAIATFGGIYTLERKLSKTNNGGVVGGGFLLTEDIPETGPVQNPGTSTLLPIFGPLSVGTKAEVKINAVPGNSGAALSGGTLMQTIALYMPTP